MKKLVLSLMLILSILALSTSNALACCAFADPPVIASVTADPATLWPPNHKMVEITLTVAGQNIDTWWITGVDSEEAFPCTLDCQTENDPDYFFEEQYLELRAERTGEGGARQYMVQIRGESCNEFDGMVDCKYVSGWFAVVTVPHNMSD
jgi:hypothetical protein